LLLPLRPVYSDRSHLHLHHSLSLFVSLVPRPPRPTLFPYTTLFRSQPLASGNDVHPPGHPRGCPRTRRFGRRRRLPPPPGRAHADRKSTRLNSSHVSISYAVFCLKKKNITH